jgi:hypothetical protein
MSVVTIEAIENSFDDILGQVGTEAFIDWQKFSYINSEITNSIDEFNKVLTKFREYHHRNFIQVVKRLKSIDLPDLIRGIKSKRLPK